MLRDLLEGDLYEVVEAYDGDEGLLLYRENPPYSIAGEVEFWVGVWFFSFLV
jgi:CheY-like chemotaxis protein